MIPSLLFTSSKIGPLQIRNRTIRAAAFEGMCPGHEPSEMLIDYHRSVAAGGIGMTTAAYASVTRNGLSFPHQLWLRREIISPLRKFTDTIHKEGAAASVQIGHCGNMSKKSVAGSLPVSASGGLNIYSPTWSKALTKNEIEDMAKAFGVAVNTAREGGFDAVEVHAGHGYLISQFLSPYTNRRKDEFGGSLENRMRFMKMVMAEVMKAAGNDMAVLVKMNMRDGFRGGMELPETIQVAHELEKCGAHALVLSGGFVSKAPMYVMRGAMPIHTLTYYMDNFWLKMGVRLAGHWMIKTVPFKEAYFFDDALEFRKEIKIPLVYVGGLLSREKIDMVLNAGFEFVSMARALLHEPGFVNRMKTEEMAVNECAHSNYCIARMYSKEMACQENMHDLPASIIKEIYK
jgi:2,4-dienoyl-CoA reductase-like NADH-dependent reductase (Old Yellow Enzyme family)